jgi:hemerythrin
MPNRVQWEPRHSVGNGTLDDHHRNILAQCNALADCLADDSEEGERRFHKAFDELMAFARNHFAAEEALLASRGYPALEDHRNERDEFDYLAAEIITIENFDKDELQTFLVLWWTGHIMGAVKKHRAFLSK